MRQFYKISKVQVCLYCVVIISECGRLLKPTIIAKLQTLF